MIIGIIGYGKMGKKIELISIKRGHSIGFKINSKNTNQLNENFISKVDVAIEFSAPKYAFHNISFCLRNNIPIVSGTTGWLTQMEEIQLICKKNKGTLFYSENFSVGLNIFLTTTKLLTRLTKGENYNIQLTETHHKSKKDAPSGTALMIQKKINNLNTQKKVPIFSKRIGNIIGEHHLKYTSQDDIITLKHSANNRDGFAKGAILAAEFIKDKIGLFSMKDLINTL
tara:strand:- start:532 stop:1212 length:681 start_codon:yes stop_codon:yes gene_type:complete